jgi:hypothetical protein
MLATSLIDQTDDPASDSAFCLLYITMNVAILQYMYVCMYIWPTVIILLLLL